MRDILTIISGFALSESTKEDINLCFFTQHVFFHSTTSQEYPKLFVSSASMPLIAVMN